MEEFLPTLMVLAIAAVVLLLALGVVDLRNYTFLIKLVDGRAVVSRGKVKADFVDGVAEVCAEYGVRSGWVGGVRRGRHGTRLIFSRTIPQPCQQRIRNIWGIAI